LDARWQHVEHPPPTAEQHWDLGDLQLIQYPGLERPLRRVRAMYQHVAVPGGCLCLRHCALDPIEDVRHQWIVGDRGTGWPVAWHEDGATVVITAPVIDLLHGAPSSQNGAVPVHDLVVQLSSRPGRSDELAVWTDEPLVQPHKAVAAGVVRLVVR